MFMAGLYAVHSEYKFSHGVKLSTCISDSDQHGRN